MKVIHLGGQTADSNVEIPTGAVVAVGNFDAVHQGHVDLIWKARALARERKTPLAVLTFEPHPRRIFRPDDPPFRVTPLDLKVERLEKEGVEIVYVLAFDWNVAGLSAEEFIKNVIDKIKPVVLTTGEDFKFGHNRTGNLETLKTAGYEALVVPLKTDPQHGVISATRIRGLIQSGHISEANNLLGWAWVIRGKVQKGDQRGRELGFPTANVPLNETIHPSYGVYATLVRINDDAQWRMAATNIGIRPMFEVKTALVEAHILDFSEDIYGKDLEIMPIRKIRDEEKYESLDALIAQIKRDCLEARRILAKDLEPVA
ncbi:MAG: riboflavin biosynthesis protein RibF [Alphaproteobacteria bacterium]|nr:riboflavin biosynthesis protein RibF [Alphaproteobacteria bacterium]